MIEYIKFIMNQPACWGGLGAFVYAAPNWLTCITHCKEKDSKIGTWFCTLELFVRLTTGAIIAAAFGELAEEWTKISHSIAVATVLGFLANPAAPWLLGGFKKWLEKKVDG